MVIAHITIKLAAKGFPYKKMQIYNLFLKIFSVSLNSLFSKSD